MPGLHVNVDDETAGALRARADEADLSLSSYLAKVVVDATREGRPPGYIEAVAGSCPDFAYSAREPTTPAEPLDLARTRSALSTPRR